MNLNYTDEDLIFREEVKCFIRDNLSSSIQKRISNGGAYTKEETVKWQKALYKNGWFAYNWPIHMEDVSGLLCKNTYLTKKLH